MAVGPYMSCLVPLWDLIKHSIVKYRPLIQHRSERLNPALQDEVLTRAFATIPVIKFRSRKSPQSWLLQRSCWLACHRLRSTGFNPFFVQPFFVQQLALCCSYQVEPVSQIWCVCSSTGFPFHGGFSSSCAWWRTGVFITRRRYT